MRILLDNGAYIPEKAHDTDAGYDLRSPVDAVLHPRSSVTIDTGVHVELPAGTAGMLKSKSGLNVKHDITSEGVIDVGYTGSIRAKLYNHGDNRYMINAGDKITQLVIVQLAEVGTLEIVDKLEETKRGANGFGSSGR